MTYEQIAKMAHALPQHETSALFFFILGYMGEDMPECIKKEIVNRYMRRMEKESV
jgi:hypothetical protein